MLLFFFFAFFLGFLLNFFDNDFRSRLVLIKQKILDREIGIAVLAFIVLLIISLAVTVFRYSNFYPFITNNYHNLIVNINGQFNSNEAIFWTINSFFNYIVGFLFLFSIFNILRNIKEIIIALIVIISATLLSSFMSIYQYFVNPYIGSFKFWISSGRLNATFTDPNALGAYIILLFPILIIMIIVSRKIYLKVIFCLILIPFMMMVGFSGSRNALLGIFFAVVMFIVFGILFRSNRFKSISRKRLNKKVAIKIVVAALVVILIISSLLGIFLTENVVKNKILSIGLVTRIVESGKALIFYYKQGGFLEALKSISNYRYIYWNQAIKMTKDYPITGVGTGSYMIELPDYLYRYERGFSQIDTTGNYYLQILAELGIPGLFIILFLFFLFIKKTVLYLKIKKLKREYVNFDWVLIGLFISFLCMLVIQFFGPHTNFTEIQMTFWLIIGLMMAYIKLSVYNTKTPGNDYNLIENFPKVLRLQRSLKLDLKNTISIIIIVLIFTISFSISSLTGLSIAVKQDRDFWANNYGFYNFDKLQGKKVRWIADDASIVLEKKGSAIIIPLQDYYPIKNSKPNIVKFYIDNLLIKKIKLEDDSWYNLKLDIPKFAGNEFGNRFTLTIVVSRSWVPKELGINRDTRVIGLRIGEISFIE
jgi:O-antigen ligase